MAEYYGDMKAVSSLEITTNTLPNRWVYGVLAKNKIETIKEFREEWFLCNQRTY